MLCVHLVLFAALQPALVCSYRFTRLHLYMSHVYTFTNYTFTNYMFINYTFTCLHVHRFTPSQIENATVYSYVSLQLMVYISHRKNYSYVRLQFVGHRT